MNFSEKEWLSLLWLFLPAIVLFVYAEKKYGRFSAWPESKEEAPLIRKKYAYLKRGLFLKNSLFLLGLAFLVLAMVGPKWGIKERIVERKGIDVVVALDLSKSMLTADITPSRIVRAKMELSALIDSRRGDRIGIVAFAGTAVVACPLTMDYGAAKNFLKNLEAGMIPRGGTDLSGPIKVASDMMRGQAGREKVIVLLTDGEDTIGDPLRAAEEAAENGISVYALAFGTKGGGPVPIMGKDGKIEDYKRGKEGTPVISRVDDKILNEIAKKGGGKSFLGGTAVTQLAAELDRKDKSVISSRLFTLMEERFQYPLMLAFIFLSLEMLIPLRRKS